MRLNEAYQPLFVNPPPTRYFLITGGRGSGKSFHLSTFLLNLTYEKGHTILFTRYTMISAHISIIPEFLEKIDILGKHADFDITKADITNKATGSKILFRGIKTSSGNQTANLKSIQGVTTWVLDEAEELLDEETFSTIDLSIRHKSLPNRVIMVMNPSHRTHFIYKRWFEHGKRPDTTYIHTSYRDNIVNLSDSFLEIAADTRLNYNDRYQHIFLGHWKDEAAESPFIYTFDSKAHANPNYLFDPDYPIHLSFDFNLNPLTCTVFQMEVGKFFHAVDSFKMDNANLPDMLEMIKARYGRYLWNARVTGDALGKNRSLMERDNRTYYDMIQAHLGLQKRQIDVPPNPSHAQSRMDCNYVFRFHPGVNINPVKCPELIRDIMIVEASPDNSIIKGDRNKQAQQADFLDNFRYAVNTWLYKWIKKDMKGTKIY